MKKLPQWAWLAAAAAGAYVMLKPKPASAQPASASGITVTPTSPATMMASAGDVLTLSASDPSVGFAVLGTAGAAQKIDPAHYQLGAGTVLVMWTSGAQTTITVS